MSQSGLDRAPLLCAQTGIYIGTAVGGATSLEAAYRDMLLEDTEPAPLSILRSMTASPAAHLSIRYRLAGPNITVSSACASSSIAIGEAFHAIRAGRLDTALAGGAEACLVPGVIRAWDAMRVLAPKREDQPAASCRPFSRDRQGLVLGEGAAMFVLESLASARERFASPLCEMLGYACTADASHIARPDAEGQATAMLRALADACIENDSIDYINAHGTGTRAGDVCETLAIRKVFGGRAAGVAISATKSAHGHLLGAAGAMELAVTLVAMRDRFIPATLHLFVPDPDCDLDYVPGAPRPDVTMRRVMSNSFAFGGSNAVLIAGIAPES